MKRLDENALYMGDNGRLFCGRLRCAGMSAHFSGYTRAGQPVHRVTLADLREWPTPEVGPMRCEDCHREVSLVLNERGYPTMKEVVR